MYLIENCHALSGFLRGCVCLGRESTADTFPSQDVVFTLQKLTTPLISYLSRARFGDTALMDAMV